MISRTAEASGLTSIRAQALRCLIIPSEAISKASPVNFDNRRAWIWSICRTLSCSVIGLAAATSSSPVLKLTTLRFVIILLLYNSPNKYAYLNPRKNRGFRIKLVENINPLVAEIVVRYNEQL